LAVPTTSAGVLGLRDVAPAYEASLGAMHQGDALDLLRRLPDGSVNLVVTSPPYALHFKKEYGNVTKGEYVDWLQSFAVQIRRVLTDDGSFVLNIGGSYNAGVPTIGASVLCRTVFA
jgi:site-specific DNA-methyltransferase (cytosine-N4-specific)